MKTHDFMATYQEGVVSRINARQHLVKVTLPALDDFETGWLPMLTPNAGANQFYCLPDVGELVAVILDARGENGVVLGAMYNDVDLTPTDNKELWVKKFSNGTVISHDRSSGDVVVNTAGIVTVTAANVVVNGDLTVNGSITATGDVVGQSVSLVKHVHRGDSGGKTSVPQ